MGRQRTSGCAALVRRRVSFYACAPLEPAHGRHNYRPCTHVGVFVVAVGSQENFGHFVHPAEEERQLPLVGGGQKKLKNN